MATRQRMIYEQFPNSWIWNHDVDRFNPLFTTLILTMGFLVSWKLTFAAIFPLPILAFIMQYLGKKIHERYMVAQMHLEI